MTIVRIREVHGQSTDLMFFMEKYLRQRYAHIVTTDLGQQYPSWVWSILAYSPVPEKLSFSTVTHLITIRAHSEQ